MQNGFDCSIYSAYIAHLHIYIFLAKRLWHTDCIHIAYIFLIFHLIIQLLFGLQIVNYHVILSLVHAATLYLLQVQDKRLTIILHLFCNACVNKRVIARQVLTCMCTKVKHGDDKTLEAKYQAMKLGLLTSPGSPLRVSQKGGGDVD